MSKIVSTVATLIACAEAAAIRSPENVAVQNGNVIGNSTLNALDNKARIAEQGKQGTLLHWYARLGLTKVANLAETTGLIGGGVSGSVSSTSSTASKPLKVVHYNTYLGQQAVLKSVVNDVKNGVKGVELPTKEEVVKKLSKLKDWLKEQDADIVGLAECNLWDKVLSIPEMAEALGYPYGEYKKGNAPTRIPDQYSKPASGNLMVLSKAPIQQIPHPEWDTDVEKCLHAKTFGINVFQTHLSSKTGKMRYREVRAIYPELQRVTIAGEPLIMMGDMNSIVNSYKYSDASDTDPVLEKMKIARGGKAISKNCIDGEKAQWWDKSDGKGGGVATTFKCTPQDPLPAVPLPGSTGKCSGVATEQAAGDTAVVWAPDSLPLCKKNPSGTCPGATCLIDMPNGITTCANPWKLDFRALNKVRELLTEVQPVAEPKFDFTYPNAGFRPDQKDDPPLRIDGVFVNDVMMKNYPVQTSKIAMGGPLKQMSDHFPLVIDFK